MNAFELARVYMARDMAEKDFFTYVMECIEKVLKEREYETEVFSTWDESEDSCILVLKVEKKIFSLSFNCKLIGELQTQDPYALDKFIWEKIEQQGLQLERDHYLKTVFKEKERAIS